MEATTQGYYGLRRKISGWTAAVSYVRFVDEPGVIYCFVVVGKTC